MKFFLIVFTLFSLGSIPAAHSQGSVGNGGKDLGAVLTGAITDLYKILLEECEKQTTSVLRGKFCQAPADGKTVADSLFDQIMITKVDAEFMVYGKDDYLPRDAVNDFRADGTAFVIYSIKKLYDASPEVRKRILVHEFMTLIKKEKSDSYGFSSLLIGFLSQNDQFEKILTTLPEREITQKTFVGLEATLPSQSGPQLVLLRSAQSFYYFCVAKGFSTAVNLVLRDVSVKEWDTLYQLEPAVIEISEAGLIIQRWTKPNASMRVIQSVTCK